jgi:hypothetical protein
VSREYEALHEHCRVFNRPYESILRTYVNFGLELVRPSRARYSEATSQRSTSASTGLWARREMRWRTIEHWPVWECSISLRASEAKTPTY